MQEEAIGGEEEVGGGKDETGEEDGEAATGGTIHISYIYN